MANGRKFKQVRRSVRQRLAKSIGKHQVVQTVEPGEKAIINNILICRPNHRLGNLLLITPLLQEIIYEFPHCKIDLFVKGGLAPILFKNYKNVHNIVQLPKKPLAALRDFLKYLALWGKLKKRRYDLVLNIDKGSSSGRIATNMANGHYKFFGDENENALLQYPDYLHIAKHPVYNFRLDLLKLGYDEIKRPMPSLNIFLSNEELDRSKKILNELVKNDRKTIAIFTYATGEKCYPAAWWADFYEQLKTGFPMYNIVEVLPVENISAIQFLAPSFYSKDVREICAFIANTSLFIGADSGIMHLASASQVPTVGLFSGLNSEIYSPYNNNSMALNTYNNNVEACVDAIKALLLRANM